MEGKRVNFDKNFLMCYREVVKEINNKINEQVFLYCRRAKPGDVWWLGEDAEKYHILVKLIPFNEIDGLDDFELELKLGELVSIIPSDMLRNYKIYFRDYVGD